MQKRKTRKWGILRTSNASTLFFRLASFSITLDMMVVMMMVLYDWDDKTDFDGYVD